MKLSQFIRENIDDILEDWEQFAASIPGTGGMDKKELQDHARQMLETVIRQIDAPESQEEGEQRTHQEHRRHLDSNAAGGAHATDRLAHGFTLYQIMAEFRTLRASVLKMWRRYEAQVDGADLEELANFNDGVDRVLMDSVSTYSDQLDQSRQMFLGVLGHDLRNPLNAMMMCATLIRQDTEVGSRQFRCATTILRSGDKIEHILGDLLDLARTRLGGNIPLDRRTFDIATLCEEVVTELQAAHPEADIHLHREGNLTGEWDEVRINQLLWNLGGNAIKHGTSDTPVIIRAREEEDRVRIEVHNRGYPIPDAAYQSIFDPLTALKKKEQTRATESGIGLGLYICRLIVEAHGGEIRVSSSKEEGTRFCVFLPKYCPPDQAREKQD